MIADKVRAKIQDLISRAPGLAATSQMGLARDNQHISQCRGWITEALNIVEVAVPVPENAYRRQIERIGEARSGRYPQTVGSMAAILSALLSDIDAGLLVALSNTITVEAFDNFLDHAEEYRKKGRKQEAGVIAGVVFEDTLRRICRDKGIVEKGVPLDTLINTLAGAAAITGQQSKQSKVAAHVRTKATHAQWDEFDLEGVGATITITRVLMTEHLSG